MIKWQFHFSFSLSLFFFCFVLCLGFRSLSNESKVVVESDGDTQRDNAISKTHMINQNEWIFARNLIATWGSEVANSHNTQNCWDRVHVRFSQNNGKNGLCSKYVCQSGLTKSFAHSQCPSVTKHSYRLACFIVSFEGHFVADKKKYRLHVEWYSIS